MKIGVISAEKISASEGLRLDADYHLGLEKWRNWMPPKIRTSKTLAHHHASKGLYSDRDYIAFEESTFRSDLGVMLMQLAEKIPPGEERQLCEKIQAAVNAPFNENGLYKLKDDARRLAWSKSSRRDFCWADLLLMFTSFASSGNYIAKKAKDSVPDPGRAP